MTSFRSDLIHALTRSVIPAIMLSLGLLQACLAADAPAPLTTLRIGATGTITGVSDGLKEKAGLELLQRFIKEETGFTSAIKGDANFEELATQMAKGDVHLGVFQGYEYAWLQEKYPELKPLAIGINVHRYPVVCIVTNMKNPTKDFAGLQGQPLALPVTPQKSLHLYLDRLCEAAGKKKENYFSSISTTENVEDCLDDIVDGKLQYTVLEQATLETYQKRKPGRFNQLKEITRSQPFPPFVTAYYGKFLDEATLAKFKQGLLGAARKEKGELLLTLSRLSSFEVVPNDFNQVLAETRKAYPQQKK